MEIFSPSITGSTGISGSLTVTGGITGSLFGTSSFAITASYALNAPTTDISGLLTTASFNNYTGSNVSQFAGTASFATTASFAPNYVLNSDTASMLTPYVLTSSTSSMTVLSSSFARTASFAINAATASNILGGKATHIPYFITDTTLATSSLYQSGSTAVIINLDSNTAANPEALFVWQPSQTSFNVISGKGNLNNYLQLNIQNNSPSNGASSDVVATSDQGNESINYIDMGINSSTFNGALGLPNDAYLYSTGNDLHIGNATPGKPIQFFAGGIDTVVNKKFELNADGQHNMTGSLEISGKLKVNQGITGSLLGNATTADYATNAGNASTANFATNADSASVADYATNAGNASTANFATTAGNGGVTNIVAGSGITLIPTSGVGSVTVISGGGGGGVTIISGSNVTQSFNSSTTWTFDHNLGTRTPIINVFDVNYNQVIPENIFLNTTSSATITFTTAESGFAIASLGGATGTVLSSSYSLFSTYATTASNYAETDPVFSAKSGSYATTGSNRFLGNQSITGSLFVSSSAVTLGQFAGNQNGYVEFSIRNNSTGVSASGDIAVYANDGTVSNNYIDMGINNSGMNSTYSYFGTDFGNAHDAYVYNVGGDLRIGNATSVAPFSQSFHLFSNPTATPNITMTGSRVGINKSSSLNATLDVVGTVIVTGSLTVSGSGTFKNIGPALFTGSIGVSGSQTFVGNNSLTGSFSVSGSTLQTGNNTLIGNTTLSGSISISGSQTFKGNLDLTGSFTITGSTVQIGNNTLTGNTSLTGSIAMTGSILIFGDILPQVSSSYNLGSETQPWKSLYVQSGSISIQSDIPGNPPATISNQTGNITITSAGFSIKSGSTIPFSIDTTGRTKINTPNIPNNDPGAFSIVGSSDGYAQTIGLAGRMVHVTGNDGLPSRVENDAFGTNAFAAYIGRSARGIASSPSPSQTGDVLARYAALGYGTTGYLATNINSGPPLNSIDFVAKQNYNDASASSAIEFYTSPQDVRVRTLSATISTTGIQTSGSVVATSFTGSLYGTASWATNIQTASYVLNAVSASYSSTASYAPSYLSLSQTGSFATTGSNTFKGNQIISGSITTSGSLTVNGPAVFNDLTVTITGSLLVTGSGFINSKPILTSATTSSFENGFGWYGAFCSTGSQTNPVANISRSMQLDTVEHSVGVTIVNGSRITFANGGVYNIQFSAQLQNTSAGDSLVNIWFKKNGTNVSRSNGITNLAKQAGNKTIAAWNYVDTANKNDYLEIVWQSSDTTAELHAAVATGNLPLTPSVIITATQVG